MDSEVSSYRGTSPVRKRSSLGPSSKPMPMVLGGSWGGGRVLMGEVPLYALTLHWRAKGDSKA